MERARMTDEDRLKEAVGRMPLFRTVEELRVEEVLASDDGDGTGPSLMIELEKAPAIPSRSRDKDTHDKMRKADTPPLEKVTVRQLGEESPPLAVPFGTALNIAVSLLDGKIAERDGGPFVAFSSEEEYQRFASACEEADKARKVKGLVERLASEGELRGAEKVTRDRAFSLFYMASAVPGWFAPGGGGRNGSGPEVCCLVDLIFFTLAYAEQAFESAPVLKRCRTCGRLFFARPSNRVRCYFEVPDDVLEGMSCFAAYYTRKPRDASNKRQYGEVLKRLRGRHYEADGYLNDSGTAFERAREEREAELEDHLWRYRELLEWAREYERTGRLEGGGGDE